MQYAKQEPAQSDMKEIEQCAKSWHKTLIQINPLTRRKFICLQLHAAKRYTINTSKVLFGVSFLKTC